MKTKIVEVTNGNLNWGKFLLGRFDGEWAREAKMLPGHGLLSSVGWGPEHVLVLDLQTGEGCVVRPGGAAHADLEKHRVWVCPMFQPFLEWLYRQPDLSDLDSLPDALDLKDAEFQLRGHRRPGPPQAGVEPGQAMEEAECASCGAPILTPAEPAKKYVCLGCLQAGLESRRMRQ